MIINYCNFQNGSNIFGLFSQLFHTLYFCLAMLNDITGTNEVESKKQSKSQKFRDFLFTTLIFPLGVVSISSIYKSFCLCITNTLGRNSMCLMCFGFCGSMNEKL